jgi:hypothetical protein
MSDLNAPMSAEEFFINVERHFRHLIVEHSFFVTKKEITGDFDICKITLQSKDWHIRIERERGSVYVEVAPTSHPEMWFALRDVITFLRRESQAGQEIWFGPLLDWSIDYNERLVRQLRWYGEKLEEYASQITALFGHSEGEQTLSQLRAWKKYRDQLAKDALARGDYPKYHT